MKKLFLFFALSMVSIFHATPPGGPDFPPENNNNWHLYKKRLHIAKSLGYAAVGIATGIVGCLVAHKIACLNPEIKWVTEDPVGRMSSVPQNVQQAYATCVCLGAAVCACPFCNKADEQVRLARNVKHTTNSPCVSRE